MAIKAKALQILANHNLPDDLKDYNREYNKKTLNDLLKAAALKYPERYNDIIKSLADVGRNASYLGSETVTLNDLRPMFDKDALIKQMYNEVNVIKATVKNKKERTELINDIYAKYATLLEDMTMEAGKLKENNLFNAVKSGARGNSTQLKMLITAPSLYTDAKDNIIPLFIKKSFSEGLTLPEYLASTFGSRKAVIQNKRATAEAGGLGKEMDKVGANLVITSKKDNSPDNIGRVLPIDDSSLKNRVLAKSIAGIPKGTVLDRDMINYLKKHNVKKVIVHSPIATIQEEGLSAEAFGLDYNHRLPPIGFHAGMTSATALSEPMAQGALNSKHTCLFEDTLVKMADGSIKKIKDIEIGDMVLGSDKQGNIKPVKVTNKIDQGIQECYNYKFSNNAEVKCTEDHKFLIKSLIKPIKQYNNENDIFITSNKDNNVKLIDIEYIGDKQCYDITVDHPDHLFVLANDIICSNSGAFKGKKNLSGLPYLIQFLESPETFKDKATVSELDGTVDKIEDAPQGGKYIYINNEKHYVLPDTDIFVKKGDNVEAGDIISDGLADPEDIVRLKGIGEGRKYYSERLKQLLDDSSAKADLRNTEVVARNAINHIEITDPDGFAGYLPGDIVSYNKIEANYKPRESSKEIKLNKDNIKNYIGKYLEKPILHYSIGTRLSKSMLENLNDLDINDIVINDEPPGFKPVLTRLREAASKNEEDWLVRANTSYIKQNYIEAATKGLDTNVKENINPYARMGVAYDFAKNLKETSKF